MSRAFQFNRPTLVCDGPRCYSRHVFTTREMPPEPSGDPRIYWNAEWREKYDAEVRECFHELEAQPTPKGWLGLSNGSELLSREVGYDADDPEFCSTRCLRLWIGARERYASKE